MNDTYNEIGRLNFAIGKLRAELKTATEKDDIAFLSTEIQVLSRIADNLANLIEFEP